MNIVFIGGAPCSGTTLVQEMLCSGPQTNPRLGEAKYLKALIQAFQVGQSHFPGGTEHFFASESAFIQFHQNILTSLFQAETEKHPQADWLVVKDNDFSGYLNEVMQLLPHSRILILVRDPRDVIAAQLHKGQYMQAKELDPRYYRAEALPQLLQAYRRHYRPLLQTLKQTGYTQQFRVIKYEHLVTDIQAGLTYLSEWLDLDLSHYNPQKPWGNTRPESRSQQNHSVNTQHPENPLSPAYIGSYSEYLTPAQTQTIESGCRELIQVFNYPPSESPSLPNP